MPLLVPGLDDDGQYGRAVAGWRHAAGGGRWNGHGKFESGFKQVVAGGARDRPSAAAPAPQHGHQKGPRRA